MAPATPPRDRGGRSCAPRPRAHARRAIAGACRAICRGGGGRLGVGSVSIAGAVGRVCSELGVVPRRRRAQRVPRTMHGGKHVVIVDRDPRCCEG
eukprot:1036061-Pleurochrysis_carterae.AAC.1